MSNTQNSPGSLGSIADDEAALKQGRGGTLAMLGVLAVVALGGAFMLLSGDDEARVYRELGKKINGLRQAHFDQFWACALQGELLKDIKTNTDLTAQIDGRASDHGAAYALHVRDKCMPKLQDIGPQLDTLIIPADLAPHVNAMRDATGKLRAGYSAFISHLDTPDTKYDTEGGRVYLDNIARGWFEFKQAHAAVNKAIKDKLGEP
jgi:hypothetical protein